MINSYAFDFFSDPAEIEQIVSILNQAGISYIKSRNSKDNLKFPGETLIELVTETDYNMALLVGVGAGFALSPYSS